MKYTYLWLRADGTPYYVGMGNKRRASARHRIGHAPPRERIILQDWPTEAEAREAERFLIALFGRMDTGSGCLRNLTDGGEGAPNPTALVRQRQSEGTKRKLAATPLTQLQAYGRQGAVIANARMTKAEKIANGRKGANLVNTRPDEQRNKRNAAASASIKIMWSRLTPAQRAKRNSRCGQGWPKMNNAQKQLATHNRWHIGQTRTRYGMHTNTKDPNCLICNTLNYGY
jgi:hypothetical protein